MIPNFTTNNTYTPAQKFVTERLIELVFTKTIDSYRVRLNNPLTSLIEVKHVLTDFQAKKIKYFDKTVKPVIEEAFRLIKDDKTLQFINVSETYIINLLRNPSEREYLQLYYATNLLLRDNADYLIRLFDFIEAEIGRVNGLPALNLWELITLNNLLEYLATQLIAHGYSKRYLYSLFVRSFSDASGVPFTEAFAEIKPLSTKDKEEFVIIFQLRKTKGQLKDVALNSPYELPEDEKNAYAALNNKTETFLTDTKKSYYYLRVNLMGLDFASVIEDAKKELFTIIDLLHLGFPDRRFEFHSRCLVIGLDWPQGANVQPITHTTDGNFKSDQALYELLQEKVEKLSGKKELEKESYRKIVSAFRHLRLGTEADESEQQFINYWIGLEYIFSNYDISESTVVRLKEYFTMAHANAYLHRNLIEFCLDMQRLKVEGTVPEFDMNLQFLKKIATFEHIIAHYSAANPLLAFRAYLFKKIIQDKKTKDFIIQHKKNLEWHLTRCYRVRNEIVHDAAIHLNIHSITANLRYYLIFILTDLVQYLVEASQDINMTGSISLEDYFILQEIKYRSHEANSFAYEILVDESSVTEIFT